MLRSITVSAAVVLFVLASFQGIAQVSIIPKPAELVMAPAADSFVVSPQTTIVVSSPKLQPSADFLNDYIKQVYGFNLKTSKKAVKANSIDLRLQQAGGQSGAYSLNVNNKGVSIDGADESGVFYGMQSLLQLLPLDKAGSLTIPGLKINDKPRYAYRGMMLDVARHFFPPDFVKKYIDYLALHKMNYLHWHLTEDQGWRIEIKKHPKLTEIGAWRNGTIIDHHPGTGNTNQRYGGFYTQDQVKDIVAYAAKRYITVVPEIEMPGHAGAAIASYPNLSCFPNKPTDLGKHASEASKKAPGKYVQEQWGVYEDVFCAANDSVFLLLQDVIDEVSALFPSQYIHIGGDECPKENWKKCPRCQARIKELKLKDEHELQSYFVQRMEKYINSKGKILIGWDEILEGGLAPNAWVMSWRGEAGGIEAAKQNHNVIMTPNTYVYLDYYQGKPSLEPLAIGGYLPLEKVYSYEPMPAALTAEQGKYIKGVQANVWTEYIATPEKAEYMSMPRMAAVAEVAWTEPALKNYADFQKRMEAQYRRYELKGINYSKSAFDVRYSATVESTPGRATVSMAADAADSKILYTMDGSEPNTGSILYTKPVNLWKTTTLKAATFRSGKQLGKTVTQVINLD
jgi:hexosaminidase